jgi:transposase, IS30 family
MTYHHLTQEERCHIFLLYVEKRTVTEIARALDRHKSTISRELQRNSGDNRWSPFVAQKYSRERRQNSCNARRVSGDAMEAVADYIRLDLSPEQAIKRLSLELGRKMAISHDTVYRRIDVSRQMGDGELFKRLRRQKVRRKPYRNSLRCSPIKNRVSIDERPVIVDLKARLGDWEGDTVIGKGHQGVLLTLVERSSRYLVAALLESRQADGVAAAINRHLLPHKDKCHTITFDNGLEFAKHADVSACLGADIYFAHPYHSWERGANENANGLIRQYYPKSTNLKKVRPHEIRATIHKLNHRPRKCLGYKTPHEVFYNLDVTPLNNLPVALRI